MVGACAIGKPEKPDEFLAIWLLKQLKVDDGIVNKVMDDLEYHPVVMGRNQEPGSPRPTSLLSLDDSEHLEDVFPDLPECESEEPPSQRNSLINSTTDQSQGVFTSDPMSHSGHSQRSAGAAASVTNSIPDTAAQAKKTAVDVRHEPVFSREGAGFGGMSRAPAIG